MMPLNQNRNRIMQTGLKRRRHIGIMGFWQQLAMNKMLNLPNHLGKIREK